MSNSPYTIRNYQPADFDNFVRLAIEAEELEPTGHRVSPRVMAEHLGLPNYSPERDLFIVEIGGSIIGYMNVMPELAIGRVVLGCWIHPEHRRRGLAIKLLSCAICRAQELGASVVHVNIGQDNVVAKSVLSRLGFECVRRFLELRLEMTKVRWPDTDRAALGCRHLRRGEEDQLARIQNRSFAGSWGYNPNTVEAITYSLNMSNRSPEDVVLVGDGDKVLGYCWTVITDEREAAGGARKGRIYMMGADPDYRGAGVGRRVLLAGLAHLQNRGVEVAGLSVDSENKVACALYRSVGFEVRTTSSLWYEKAVGLGHQGRIISQYPPEFPDNLFSDIWPAKSAY